MIPLDLINLKERSSMKNGCEYRIDLLRRILGSMMIFHILLFLRAGLVFALIPADSAEVLSSGWLG